MTNRFISLWKLLLQICCVSDSCTKPSILYGSVTPDTESVESGSSYTVSCQTNYQLTGQAEMTCTNGKLSTAPTCTPPASCPAPSIPESILTPDTSTIESGSQVSVRCVTGYTLSGPEIVTCTDGSLSTLPSCLPDVDEDTEECTLESGCFKYPTGCESSCSFTFKWSYPRTDRVKIEVSGKPSDHMLLDTERWWLGFGFSQYGIMSNSDIYLCKKNVDVFSAVKVKGYSHGLHLSTEEQIGGGTLKGRYVDEVMSCSYETSKSTFPKESLIMFHGMGPLSSTGEPLNHYQTPRSINPDKISIGSGSSDSGSFNLRISGVVLLLGLIIPPLLRD